MQSCDEAQRFAHWEIRPRERVLIVGGEPVRIGSRAFDVLWALVQRAGLVVARAAAQRRLYGAFGLPRSL